jgi:hypothetical protein
MWNPNHDGGTNAVGRRVLRAVLLGGGGLIMVAGLARAAGAYDGTYAGKAVLVSGASDPACGAFSTSITVVGGHFTYSHHVREAITNVHGGHLVSLSADVGPDGSVTGGGLSKSDRARTDATVKGQVSGGKMDIEETFSDCVFHLSLTKT